MNHDGIDLSVVIITLNEQDNIRRCLESLPTGCEVIVLDSGSSDATSAICRDFSVSFHHREFDDYSGQKNAAIDFATRSWVLSLDADEALTPALRDRIVQCCRQEPKRVYSITRRLVFRGRTLTHGKTSDHPTRLFPRKGCRFHKAIHESLDCGSLTIEQLPETLLHYSYRDLKDYFDRFNRYTSLIAENHLARGKRNPPLALHLLRPFFEFISRYVFRLGFLDGMPGFTYALISSVYAYIKYEKLRELRDAGTA